MSNLDLLVGLNVDSNKPLTSPKFSMSNVNNIEQLDVSENKQMNDEAKDKEVVIVYIF